MNFTVKKFRRRIVNHFLKETFDGKTVPYKFETIGVRCHLIYMERGIKDVNTSCVCFSYFSNTLYA